VCSSDLTTQPHARGFAPSATAPAARRCCSCGNSGHAYLSFRSILMFQPLSGLRVIDLTQVLAGPYAAYQLALMGAEVLKIETPGIGDWAREKGDLPDLNADGMGLTYLTQNANKKSVTLNLKTPEGLEIIKRLIASADVFIENFRPGAIARL